MHEKLDKGLLFGFIGNILFVAFGLICALFYFTYKPEAVHSRILEAAAYCAEFLGFGLLVYSDYLLSVSLRLRSQPGEEIILSDTDLRMADAGDYMLTVINSGADTQEISLERAVRLEVGSHQFTSDLAGKPMLFCAGESTGEYDWYKFTPDYRCSLTIRDLDGNAPDQLCQLTKLTENCIRLIRNIQISVYHTGVPTQKWQQSTIKVRSA